MSRPISTEGIVFWTMTVYVATFALLWGLKWIDDFLLPRDKLRKKVKTLVLFTFGIVYLYCLFCYVRTLG